MGRRRYIKSRQIYELCFRARRGLPFPPLRSIQVLIESILARVQHDEKVEIIALLWIVNHPHIVARVKDAEAATRFHGQVKKQLTDVIKRLLGRSANPRWVLPARGLTVFWSSWRSKHASLSKLRDQDLLDEELSSFGTRSLKNKPSKWSICLTKVDKGPEFIGGLYAAIQTKC